MNKAKPDCGFCGRTEIEPGKFVLGPDRCICDRCVESCSLSLLDSSDEAQNIFQANSLSSARCEFCGKKSKEVWQLQMGNGRNICSECIEICNEIFGDLDAQNEVNILRAAKLRKLNNRPLPIVVSPGGWVISTQNRFLRKVFERIF